MSRTSTSGDSFVVSSTACLPFSAVPIMLNSSPRTRWFATSLPGRQPIRSEAAPSKFSPRASSVDTWTLFSTRFDRGSRSQGCFALDHITTSPNRLQPVRFTAPSPFCSSVHCENLSDGRLIDTTQSVDRCICDRHSPPVKCRPQRPTSPVEPQVSAVVRFGSAGAPLVQAE